MNIIRKWFLKRLTIDDLCQYFHEKGITFDFKLDKKQPPLYYAHKGKLYKRTLRGVRL